MVENRLPQGESASTDESFVQIVYTKVKSNGKTELVPLKLYVDGSLEQLNAADFSALEMSEGKMLLANRYELQRVLGQGGFGRTYLTLDRYRFDEPCVVKEFLPQNHGEYEMKKSRELFVREAKILHQIDRAQIPKFFACFEENNKLFLVQEYIKGQTYSALLRERQQSGRTFSEPEIIKWLQDLLPVLSYLHDRQIVHRDISPDNIMLQDSTNLPVLIDFGIGRSALVQAQGQAQNSTHSNNYHTQQSIVGKVGYAPHEQIWLGKSFPSTDLYSLAVTAVVLLTGIDPQTLTDRSSLRQQWSLQASVSDGFVDIINHMLQDVPAKRYQSAGAILADLERLVANPQQQSNRSTPATSVTTMTMPPTAPQYQMPTLTGLAPEFVTQCERELIEYVGPIGKFLVRDTLAKHPNLAPADLINLLAQHISQPIQANEFRNRLR
jgi:serine/threonine protein kinase